MNAKHPNGRHASQRHRLWVIPPGALAIALVVAAFVINKVWAADNLLGVWIITSLLIAVSFALIGLAAGRWEALFIDNRNRMSLSKLQVVLWTIPIFSALLAASCFNAAQGGDASTITGVALDSKLWALLGISLTTAVGAPIALSGKGSRKASSAELKDTKENLQAQTGVAADKIDNIGHVLTKANPADARWSDIVRGDDVGNADMIDFSKVQQLYFTLLTLLIFCLAVANQFASVKASEIITKLPVPDTGFLALLGVSGAGYLVYKGMSHSQDA